MNLQRTNRIEHHAVNESVWLPCSMLPKQFLQPVSLEMAMVTGTTARWQWCKCPSCKTWTTCPASQRIDGSLKSSCGEECRQRRRSASPSGRRSRAHGRAHDRFGFLHWLLKYCSAASHFLCVSFCPVPAWLQVQKGPDNTAQLSVMAQNSGGFWFNYSI